MTASTYDRMKAVNQDHLDNPQPGDYWHEMFCPIAEVVGVVNGWVLFHKLCELPRTENGDGTITIHTGKPRAKTLNGFRQWLSYGTIPGTWADCVSEKFKHRSPSP